MKKDVTKHTIPDQIGHSGLRELWDEEVEYRSDKNSVTHCAITNQSDSSGVAQCFGSPMTHNVRNVRAGRETPGRLACSVARSSQPAGGDDEQIAAGCGSTTKKDYE